MEDSALKNWAFCHFYLLIFDELYLKETDLIGESEICRSKWRIEMGQREESTDKKIVFEEGLNGSSLIACSAAFDLQNCLLWGIEDNMCG